jgi:hypothetical protein
MEFEIGYTDKEITPWGGMVFMRQMLEKMGFRKVVNAQGDLLFSALQHPRNFSVQFGTVRFVNRPF